MAFALAIVLFVTIALAVFCFGAAAYAPSCGLGKRLRSRKWLIQAGYREQRHFTMYLGSRVLAALLGMLAVVVIAQGFDPILMIGAGGFGFFIPGFMLKKRMIKDRQRRITVGLPDAADLIAICIEAGLSPAESLAHVSKVLRQAHPDLSEELYLVNREMHAGYSLDEALSNLSERTGVDDIKVLVDALVQAGPLGVVRVLRAYPNSLRTIRQQRTRAQAIKASIKLVELLLFLAPAVLFVTLGPALIELFRALSQGR